MTTTKSEVEEFRVEEFYRYTRGVPIDDRFIESFSKECFHNFNARYHLIPFIGFILPSSQIVNIIKLLNKAVVSVGCGVGYLEAVLSSNGIDVIGTDLYPIPKTESKENKTRYDIFKKSSAKIEVEEIGASDAVRKYGDRAVLCSFPCLDDDWSHQMLLNMGSGQILVYIGEDQGGCNANDDFFKELECSFTEIGAVDVLDFCFVHSRLYVYRKK